MPHKETVPATPEAKSARLNIRLPRAVYEWLQTEAASEDMPVSWVIRRLVTDERKRRSLASRVTTGSSGLMSRHDPVAEAGYTPFNEGVRR